MKKVALAILVIVAAFSLISCSYGGGQPAPAKSTPTTPSSTTPSGNGATVAIENFAFNPATITIDRGTKMTWTNKHSVSHTVTGSGFDSGTLGQGVTFSKVFTEAGTYAYQCAIHSYMKGTVTVK